MMYQLSCRKSIVSDGKIPYKRVPLAISKDLICFASYDAERESQLWTLDGVLVASLSNHDFEVEALCFGNGMIQPVLATACKGVINIWNLSKNKPACIPVARNLGNVSDLEFSIDDRFLLASIQNELWVLDTLTCKLVATITLIDGNIVTAKFCVKQQYLIVALTEARTYNICDINEQQIIFKSCIISSSTILSLSMHPFEAFFAIGSSDGMIQVFDASLHNNILGFNVSTLMEKVHGEGDIGLSVIDLKYWDKSLPSKDENVVRSVLNEELNLVIACTSSVIVLNGNSMEMLSVTFYSDIILENPLCSLSTISDVSFGISDNELHIAVSSLFSNDVHICRLENRFDVSISNLTVLSFEPLTENSPLKSSMQLKEKKQSSSKSKKTKSKVDQLNQPVVFQSKIRSSGYSKETPRAQMFQPKINQKHKTVTSNNHVGPWGLKGDVKSLGKEYPTDSLPPTKLNVDIKISDNDSSINQISFSDSGKSLSCALSDHSALLLKIPSMKSVSLNGHNGVVNTALMNHESNMVITSSDDSTVKMWLPNQSEPIFNMTHKHNFRKDNVNSSGENTKFTKPFAKAQFYYNDNFLLMSHENSLLLYKYHIDLVKNDVKRYQNNNKYKLVKDFAINESKQITTFSAINSFYSYIAICACSNRDLVIFDVNKCQNIRTINDAHTRPVHSLCQNQASSFVTQAPEAYDLFITAAVTDGVKLWDLRVNRCIRKFDAHLNRAQKVGLCYSPCSKFIAVGSEDNSCYIYDIRSVSYLHRLTGQKDVVTALAFHPQFPQIACGTASGHLRFYNSE